MLTWSANCAITNSASAETFPITNTKPYFSAVNISNQDIIKLLMQLKSSIHPGQVLIQNINADAKSVFRLPD